MTSPTMETVAAAQILRERLPQLRVRVVNVVDLMALLASDGPPARHGPTRSSASCSPTTSTWSSPSTATRARSTSCVHGRPHADRFQVRGFIEEGTTTTPFDMVVRNKASRYHLVMDALNNARRTPPGPPQLSDWCERQAGRALGATCVEHLEDMPERDATGRWGTGPSRGDGRRVDHSSGGRSHRPEECGRLKCDLELLVGGHDEQRRSARAVVDRRTGSRRDRRGRVGRCASSRSAEVAGEGPATSRRSVCGSCSPTPAGEHDGVRAVGARSGRRRCTCVAGACTTSSASRLQSLVAGLGAPAHRRGMSDSPHRPGSPLSMVEQCLEHVSGPTHGRRRPSGSETTAVASMSPLRVPITSPSSGVIPIEVSILRPLLTAVIEAPLPRWQTMPLAPGPRACRRCSAVNAGDVRAARALKPPSAYAVGSRRARYGICVA
ncbi:MAG: hypothetical protein WKF82_10345 [Nocardioidaceae bacterium]